MKIVPQKYDDYRAYDLLMFAKDNCGYDDFLSKHIGEMLDYLLAKIDTKNRPSTVYEFCDDNGNFLESIILVVAK